MHRYALQKMLIRITYGMNEFAKGISKWFFKCEYLVEVVGAFCVIFHIRSEYVENTLIYFEAHRYRSCREYQWT